MSYSIVADRLEEAKATFDEAQARKLDGPALREDRVLLAFRKHHMNPTGQAAA
jgi:hypothetical protein